jgi:hypothetical protein
MVVSRPLISTLAERSGLSVRSTRLVNRLALDDGVLCRLFAMNRGDWAGTRLVG